MYKLPYEIKYYSIRYNKWVTVPKGYKSDGATGAFDIWSEGWWCHDWLLGNWMWHGPKPKGGWDDGSKATEWQMSQVLQDILAKEGRWLRSKYWFWSTYSYRTIKKVWARLVE